MNLYKRMLIISSEEKQQQKNTTATFLNFHWLAFEERQCSSSKICKSECTGCQSGRRIKIHNQFIFSTNLNSRIQSHFPLSVAKGLTCKFVHSDFAPVIVQKFWQEVVSCTSVSLRFVKFAPYKT